MGQSDIYIWMLGLIVLAGLLSRKISIPSPLILVVAGMLISYIPGIPPVHLHPDVVLTLFLPLLVYEASVFTSWRDVNLHKRSVALLSVGHVIFITALVAITAHAMIPNLSWPMAFVLGAAVSPTDDVAIFAVAKKICIPKRIMSVLAGEGLLNDAAALILLRFSIVASITGHFYLADAALQFIAIVVFETLYGLTLGHLLGQIRIRIKEPMLEMLVSILTPFLAYIPAVYFGGSGVLATVMSGLVIGHFYLERFSPASRLLWHSIWGMIGFTVSSFLFLLVGLNLHDILLRITDIPFGQLTLYGITVSLVVIAGRFLWTFPSIYLPRWLSAAPKPPSLPWQYPFIVSWAGMRGGISLAAILIFPNVSADDIYIRSVLIFLVFCVILTTLLLQGLSLPWMLRVMGLDQIGLNEKNQDHFDELSITACMVNAVLKWLDDYEKTVQGIPEILEEVRIQKLEYSAQLKRLDDQIEKLDSSQTGKTKDMNRDCANLLMKVIDVERHALSELWQEGKMSLTIRNKLIQQLDFRAKQYSENY